MKSFYSYQFRSDVFKPIALKDLKNLDFPLVLFGRLYVNREKDGKWNYTESRYDQLDFHSLKSLESFLSAQRLMKCSQAYFFSKEEMTRFMETAERYKEIIPSYLPFSRKPVNMILSRL